MHQRMTALALTAAMLLASCTATQTLPVPRERLPQAIHDGKIEVEDDNGQRKKVRVVKVTPASEEASLDPKTYRFRRPVQNFEDVVAKWQQEPDWEVADVKVTIPGNGRAQFIGIAAALATIPIGSFLRDTSDTGLSFGGDTILFSGVLVTAILIGGSSAKLRAPDYRLAD